MFQELSSIKTRRQKLGIKQKELAELSGVSQSLIAKLEKGKLNPSYSLALKIFRALDSKEHKNEKKCRDIMTKKVIFLRKKENIKKASEMMKKNAVDQLPVIEGRAVLGSISQSLIFDKLVESGKKAFLIKVEDIMNEPFPIVNADMPVSLVLPMLKAEDAILVSDNRKLVGIITKANLI